MSLSYDEELILQSYLNCILITSLKKNNFFQSDYFRKLHFDENGVKEGLCRIGIDNQGMLLTFLYSMLVLPKERIYLDYKDKFKDLDKKIDTIKYRAKSTYRGEKNHIPYVRHIRNAIAHGKVKCNDDFVEFNDESYDKAIKRNYKCTIKIKWENISDILIGLESIIRQYIEDIKRREENERRAENE